MPTKLLAAAMGLWIAATAHPALATGQGGIADDHATGVDVRELYQVDKGLLPGEAGDPSFPKSFGVPGDSSDPFAILFDQGGNGGYGGDSAPGAVPLGDLAGVWRGSNNQNGYVLEAGFTPSLFVQTNMWVPNYEYNPVVLVGRYQLSGTTITCDMVLQRMQHGPHYNATFELRPTAGGLTLVDVPNQITLTKIRGLRQ
ncbi:MAG: hypothetical protein K6A65_05245 [Succinivibrionaceae bacterium]|nr:hypothetical protein [Succinivibrionaceae bacterium]